MSDSENFQIGTGIANSDNEDKTCLKYVIFDVIDEEDFMNQKSNVTYQTRKRTLKNLGSVIKHGECKYLDVVKTFYEGTDQKKISSWLDYCEAFDMEGLMINLDTPYEFKRTKNLIKVKKFYSVDLKCVGVEEGTGKYKGSLGALVFDYKGNKLSVGSGFTDEERRRYWEHPPMIIGKIVEIKYKEETKNKDGGVSLQFPVFQGVRTDKDEESLE